MTPDTLRRRGKQLLPLAMLLAAGWIGADWIGANTHKRQLKSEANQPVDSLAGVGSEMSKVLPLASTQGVAPVVADSPTTPPGVPDMVLAKAEMPSVADRLPPPSVATLFAQGAVPKRQVQPTAQPAVAQKAPILTTPDAPLVATAPEVAPVAVSASEDVSLETSALVEGTDRRGRRTSSQVAALDMAKPAEPSSLLVAEPVEAQPVAVATAADALPAAPVVPETPAVTPTPTPTPTAESVASKPAEQSPSTGQSTADVVAANPAPLVAAALATRFAQGSMPQRMPEHEPNVPVAPLVPNVPPGPLPGAPAMPGFRDRPVSTAGPSKVAKVELLPKERKASGPKKNKDVELLPKAAEKSVEIAKATEPTASESGAVKANPQVAVTAPMVAAVTPAQAARATAAPALLANVNAEVASVINKAQSAAVPSNLTANSTATVAQTAPSTQSTAPVSAPVAKVAALPPEPPVVLKKLSEVQGRIFTPLPELLAMTRAERAAKQAAAAAAAGVAPSVVTPVAQSAQAAATSGNATQPVAKNSVPQASAAAAAPAPAKEAAAEAKPALIKTTSVEPVPSVVRVPEVKKAEVVASAKPANKPITVSPEKLKQSIDQMNAMLDQSPSAAGTSSLLAGEARLQALQAQPGQVSTGIKLAKAATTEMNVQDINPNAAISLPDAPFCSNRLPEPEKFEPLVIGHDPLFPLPLRHRVLELTSFDPKFEFDQGESPYLAVELPQYNKPYKLEMSSVGQNGVWRPTLVFLDGNKKPVFCEANPLGNFLPATLSDHAKMAGELVIDDARKHYRYMLVFSMRELQQIQQKAKERSNVVASASNLVASLWPWSDWRPGQEAKEENRTYSGAAYGTLSVRTRTLQAAELGAVAQK